MRVDSHTMLSHQHIDRLPWRCGGEHPIYEDRQPAPHQVGNHHSQRGTRCRVAVAPRMTQDSRLTAQPALKGLA